MCGIAGFADTRPVLDAEVLLGGMNQRLHHRGPDDGGTYHFPPPAAGGVTGPAHVGLAMRRLSIIDLSAGHQPISNEDGTVWIVFNGEIYNHRELRRELERRGHQFRTHSDTEAILHAFEEYGPDCVHRLRGMFAFAIWDERKQQLFVARDHVGIKPLYWTEVQGRFLFASEIKALFQDPRVPRRVNTEGLHHYLTYLYVPDPQTMFAEISQLPPGHRLTWQAGRINIEPYWAGPAAMLDGQEGEAVTGEQVWEVLRESVSAHLLSDVPLGAFLSGGIDSTAIVALMAELSSQPVKTFSVGFEAAGLYDERAFARQVAQHFRTEHHEFAISQDRIALLPQIIRHLDEPLADASVIPNYLVAELARQHVTVALSGAGGDELFGGYRRYFGDAMARKWQRIPRVVRRGALLPALRAMPVSGDTAVGDACRLMQKFMEPLDLAPEERYLAWNAFFTDPTKQSLFQQMGQHPRSSDLMLPHFERVRHRPFADRAMYVDLKSYLPGDPLFLSDRMTMANSLEARVPFVDTRVMEFAAKIPLAQKIQGRSTKVILRQMLAARVPEEIIRRPKRGFGTPIDLWLRGELSTLVTKLLSPEVLRERGYFRPEYVQWLLQQQMSGKRDFSQHIWALLVFELWHRIFIDQDLSDRPSLSFDDLHLPAGTRSSSQYSAAPKPAGTAPAAAGEVNAEPRSQPSLRILMVADVDPVHVIGGAERMLNEHCTRLAARGHRLVVLTRREDSSLPPEELYQGVRVVRHPVAEGNPVAFTQSVLREGGKAFRGLLREEEFDLINIHQPLEAAAVLRCPESRSLPVLYTYLSPWSDEYRVRFNRKLKGRRGATAAALRAWMRLNSRLREQTEANALRRSRGILALSHFSLSQIQDIHHLSVDQATVIPGGVDIGRFQPLPDRAAMRRALGLPEGLMLFTVRNLVPRMGLDALLTAMQQVVAVRRDCHLVIGGAGMLRPMLEEQVKLLGLEQNVRFAGFIPEERLPDYYGVADLFVLPTQVLEGFGLVTIEALACGTPVLGTPVGGTREILERFDPGMLFSGVDAGSMARGILDHLPRIEESAELRGRCRQFVVETYGWDVLIPQVEALMTRLAASAQ